MDYEKKAKEIRAEVLKMLFACQSGHPGGSLSCVEMLIALYYNVMQGIDPKNPHNPDRDRMVLSKGHACPTLYAILADLGYFPKNDLQNLRQLHCHLQGHPDCKKTPGIDVNTGSLGQGASISVGLALGGKLQKKTWKTYVVLGDGECQEGLVWEAAMAAAHYKLDNLVWMLDYNHLQIDGSNEDVMDLGNIMEKFTAFGWNVLEVDGHDVPQIIDSLHKTRTGMPTFICCHTVKGKGVSFMENKFGWHGSPMNHEQFELALSEQEV